MPMASYTPAMSCASDTTTCTPAASSAAICSSVCAILVMNSTCGSSAMICSMFVSAPDCTAGTSSTSAG